MSFERFRVQNAVEIDIGCLDLNKWSSYQSSFESYTINRTRKERLLEELKQDSIDLYYKGAFSLCDALKNISECHHSWSVIKLYYSVFYLLRCYLATKPIAFIKNKGIYTLKIEEGEKPIRRDNKKIRGEQIRGDHKTTISAFIEIVGEEDVLQTNTIDGQLVYQWLMELRDQVNYRERCFHEPDQKYFTSRAFNKNEIHNVFETYVDDETFAYCFDPEHACLAVPIKLITVVMAKLRIFVGGNILSTQRQAVLQGLIGNTQLMENQAFRRVINRNI